MDKEDMCVSCVCVCVCARAREYIIEYYSAIKKNDICPFAMIWMELESIMLSKISQPKKEKYLMIDLTLKRNLRKNEYGGRKRG